MKALKNIHPNRWYSVEEGLPFVDGEFGHPDIIYCMVAWAEEDGEVRVDPGRVEWSQRARGRHHYTHERNAAERAQGAEHHRRCRRLPQDFVYTDVEVSVLEGPDYQDLWPEQVVGWIVLQAPARLKPSQAWQDRVRESWEEGLESSASLVGSPWLLEDDCEQD